MMSGLYRAARATVLVLSGTILLGAWAGCSDGTGPGSDTRLTLAWHRPTQPSAGYWRGKPAAANGRVYVEDFNRVLALNAATGAIIWSTQVRDYPTPGAENLVVREGRVFVSEVAFATALAENDGHILWQFQPDSNASLIGTSADDRAFYTGQRGIPVVYALGVADGRLLWRVNVGPNWTNPGFVTGVAVSGDTVYAAVKRYKTLNGGQSTGIIVALHRMTGMELWRYETPTEHDDFQNRPVVADDALLGNNFAGGAVIALDRATGRERWRVPPTPSGFGPLVPSVVNGDHVYVGSIDSHLYDISLKSGTVNWKKDLGGSLFAVEYCQGSVFASHGQLMRFNAADATLTGKTSDAYPEFTSNLGTDGSRVFITGHGGVYAFECQ